MLEFAFQKNLPIIEYNCFLNEFVVFDDYISAFA